jgi:glycosyltransferase involved in cell wall biosynthesis
MKVLIAHEIFPPEFVGGGENLMLKICLGLKERGIDVKVLTSGNPKIKSYKGIETIRIPVNRYLMNLAFFQVLKHAKDVDLIQASSGNLCFPSWLAAKLLNKPICCYVHHILNGYWKDVRGIFVGSLFENFEKFFISRDYDAIIFQNNSALKLGKKIGLNAKRIFMLQPGIDWEKFQVKREKEPFVLFVGSMNMNDALIRLKGIEYLLDAARMLPDVKFFIVGGGKALKKLKRDSPKNVVFTGTLVGEPLIELYARAQIFCLPSLSEGFGLTILEAMASGCAIVSTIDLGQEGILIKPKSSEQIKNAIEFLLKNPAKALRMGKKNRKIAKKFTWDNFLESLLKIYSLIAKR